MTTQPTGGTGELKVDFSTAGFKDKKLKSAWTFMPHHEICLLSLRSNRRTMARFKWASRQI